MTRQRRDEPQCSPDDGPGRGVLAGGVDDGHQGHPADVADVVVDEELEAGHVYHSEVSVIQMVMRVVFFMIRKNIFQHVHEMFSVEVTLNLENNFPLAKAQIE